uniref:Uncharacterized protein n=1 Tax=Oryzias latipes TaxID=8090 RepID=A0A3B3IAU3_ORYLA
PPAEGMTTPPQTAGLCARTCGFLTLIIHEGGTMTPAWAPSEHGSSIWCSMKHVTLLWNCKKNTRLDWRCSHLTGDGFIETIVFLSRLKLRNMCRDFHDSTYKYILQISINRKISCTLYSLTYFDKRNDSQSRCSSKIYLNANISLYFFFIFCLFICLNPLFKKTY